MTDLAPLLLLGGLALVCLASRVTGYWLAGVLTIPPRVQTFLEVLPGPLLCSLVASAAFSYGPLAGFAAVGIAIAAMTVTKSEIVSAVAGAVGGWTALGAPGLF